MPFMEELDVETMSRELYALKSKQFARRAQQERML